MTPTETAKAAPPTTMIVPPDTKELELKSTSYLQDVSKLVVTDTASHAMALNLWREGDNLQKQAEGMFEKPTKEASSLHRFLTGMRAFFADPLERAKLAAKAKADVWAEQERRRADEEARKQAEVELKRIEDQKIAEAEAAQKVGDPALAEEILNEEIATPYVPPAPLLAQVDCVGESVTFGAEVRDLGKLIRHCAANPNDRNVLAAVMPALNAIARAKRIEGEILPGVVGVKKTRLSNRGG